MLRPMGGATWEMREAFKQEPPLPRNAPFPCRHTLTSVNIVPETNLIYQDAEKSSQRRSRIVQTLNVPLRLRLRAFTRCGLADSLFEHPAQGYRIASLD